MRAGEGEGGHTSGAVSQQRRQQQQQQEYLPQGLLTDDLTLCGAPKLLMWSSGGV